jgi:hypothetical protein
VLAKAALARWIITEASTAEGEQDLPSLRPPQTALRMYRYSQELRFRTFQIGIQLPPSRYFTSARSQHPRKDSTHAQVPG